MDGEKSNNVDGGEGEERKEKKTNMAVESERKLAAGKCVWCGNAEEAEARKEENLYKRNNFSFSGKRAKVVRCKKIFLGRAYVCVCGTFWSRDDELCF